jgi:hypothetical protein
MNGINSAADQSEARATKPATQQFNQGGIVKGGSETGDNVTIRANAREMMLTQQQQAQLFNMIKNGNGGSGPIQLNANLTLDGKTFALAVANVERTNSNDLGAARQINNSNI